MSYTSSISHINILLLFKYYFETLYKLNEKSYRCKCGRASAFR